MRQPHNPVTELTTPDGRKPGRDFDDPHKPLGADMIDRGGPNIEFEAGVYGHAHHGPMTAGAGKADRAHAVAVMRKAEELMATNNPPPEDFRRALELGAGRCGLTIEQYDELIRSDDELAEFEQRLRSVYGK